MTGGVTAFVDGVLVWPDRLERGGCVVIGDGRIRHAGGPIELPPGAERIDLGGDFILPGLVDIHAHGALGRTFNEADPAAWSEILDAHHRRGTTSVLATLASDTPGQLAKALRVGGDFPAAGLIGVHLEGPYLNPEHSGAHPIHALVDPVDQSWPELLDGAPPPLMVTLAPELKGADDLVRFLAAGGTVVAAGHSGASEEVMEGAWKNGLRHVAHLWSGQSTLTKSGPWRTPGLLEQTLASSSFTGEIIADGYHVTASMARIAYRCLGRDRLCLVSDASAGTGLPKGTDFAMGAVRGTVADGVALSADGETFCGSTSFLADVLRFAVIEAGISLVDAVVMATATPARVVGLDDRIGVLAEGRRADLVVLDRDLHVRDVVQRGQRRG